jgi:hypothetical protein
LLPLLKPIHLDVLSCNQSTMILVAYQSLSFLFQLTTPSSNPKSFVEPRTIALALQFNLKLSSLFMEEPHLAQDQASSSNITKTLTSKEEIGKKSSKVQAFLSLE